MGGAAVTYWIWSIPPEAFAASVRTETFALRQHGRKRLAEVRPGDVVFAYLPGSRVIAGQFEVVSEPFEDATAMAPGRHAPHRIRVRPLVVLPEEAWVAYDGFALHLRVLDEYPDQPTPERRFRAVVQRVLHRLPLLDGKVLEFVVRARQGDDPEALMEAVEAVRQARDATPAAAPARRAAEPAVPYGPAPSFDRAVATDRVLRAIAARGFVYEPWVVAGVLAALRTKPFVLLAGVTGVGKSRLPALLAAATGGAAHLLPVRPDWTDPAETLGYTDLDGRFRAGAVLRVARTAAEAPEREHVLILDEMNLGRPEHYLAEVLSRIEARAPGPRGPESPPLLTGPLRATDAVWQAVRLPPNLALVGTVNVDESAHVFSRKVLDRAFVFELAAPALGDWRPAVAAEAPSPWPAAAWTPRALRLADLGAISDAEQAALRRAVDALVEADALLAPAGLGVGYRSRDEAALFVLHAAETPDAWRTRDGAPVDPLDVALLAKLLARIDGVRAAAHTAVASLLGWAWGDPDTPSADLVAAWQDEGRPDRIPEAQFPLTAARLAQIVEGALDEGVVSFWT